jgi:amidohydrolase
LRRDFHQHPELGFKEIRTAGIVAHELNDLGLEVSTGVGQTGIVALMEGARPGPVVLLRFDMDALPIQEATGAEYTSLNPGVMHACGHDGHTAIGLTVARVGGAARGRWLGSSNVFQPPRRPGWGGGDGQDGVLGDPRPDCALALHLWNDKPYGWLGITPGLVMAASDRFSARITGKGGHGASPHQTIDPVLAGAQVVSALQGIVARNVPPLKSAVVSVTSMSGGEAFNVIPAEVELKGTIRSFDPAVREVLLERLGKSSRAYRRRWAAGRGETWRVTPAVHNEAEVTGRVRR